MAVRYLASLRRRRRHLSANRITTTIDHRTTYGYDLALRQRIIDTIDDAKELLAPYVQVCLAA